MITQNSDQLITLYIKDEANENFIDINNVSALVVFAYLKSKKIIQKWSLNALSGYEPAIIESAEGGKISLVLNSESTKEASGGDLFIEVVIETPDVRFPNGVRRTIVTGIKIDETVETISKNLKEI